MQACLNREGCLIFSKLQKHKINLDHVEFQIRQALLKCDESATLINIDNHEKNSFQKI